MSSRNVTVRLSLEELQLVEAAAGAARSSRSDAIKAAIWSTYDGEAPGGTRDAPWQAPAVLPVAELEATIRRAQLGEGRARVLLAAWAATLREGAAA